MRDVRKKLQLSTSLQNTSHRTNLVHSKHHGWLTLGVTSIGLGVVGLGLAGQTNVVSASSSQQFTTQKSTSSTGRVWTLRPVSQIEAQIKASNKNVYNIQWGDTLSTIAEALNHTGFTTSVNRLAEINHIANVNLIYAGAKLYLQGSGENATVTTKNAAGNDQTYNLNPAKPLIVTPQQKPIGSNGQSIGNGQSSVRNTSLNTGNTGNTHANTGTSNDKSAQNKNDIEAVIKAAKEEQARLQAEREAAEKAKQEAEAKLTELLNAENGQTLAQLQTKRTAAQAAVDTAKAKVQSTTQALQAAQQAYATAKQAADTAAANTASKQTQVDAATAGINSQTSQIQSLQAQLDTINADAQAAKDPATQAKVATLKAALTKAQQGLQTYEQQLGQANQQLTVAKQAETAAQQALANAKNQLDRVNGQVTSANAELQQANTNLAALPQQATAQNSDQAKQLKTDLAHYDAQLTKLDSQLKTLNDQIQAWQQAVAAAQTKLDQAKEQTTKANTANAAAQANDTTGAGQQAQTTIDHTKANMPKDDHVPVNTDKQVTVKVDEQGHQLADTTGYKLIKTSAPVKTIQTLANGDTITTYTTTETYHQIQHFTKQVTINVDENGQTLASTNGYTKVVGADKTTTKDEVAANGDVTTITTTTITWKKTPVIPGHRDVYETVSKDENGQTITPSAAYHLVSSKPSTYDTKDPDGTVVTHHVTTNVYHQIQYFTKQVTVNVDENGQTLTSTDGYTRVSGADKTTTKDEVAQNGDVTTVTTTTVTWKKATPKPGHRDVYETVSQDEQGNLITPSDAYHLIDTHNSTKETTDPDGTVVTHHITTNVYHKIVHSQKTATVNVDEQGNPITPSADYHLLSSHQDAKDATAANGDVTTTVTTTNVYHKIVRSQKTVTVNVDENGNVLQSTDGYARVPGSDKVTSKDEVAQNGDITTVITTTITWKKTPAHQTKYVTVNVDEQGNPITPSADYHFVSSSKDSKDTTEADGTIVTTVTTTNVYHKIQHIDQTVTVNVDENGNVLQSTTGYDKVSESSKVTAQSTANNGNIHRTITVTVVWKAHESTPTDPIIASIKSADDAATKAIQHQVADEDTRVSVEQAQALTNRDLSLKVAKLFNDMVNQEQARTGHKQTALNTLDKDNTRISQRAVEVMYKFDHSRPDNNPTTGTPAPTWKYGEKAQSFNSENIAQSAITKSSIGELTTDNLASAIAKQMYKQYITDELPENNNGVTGGHYQNIINRNYDSLVAAVYVVDHGSYYEVASAVSTGQMGTYNWIG